ncbi:MAG: FtsQ-type POTRA domain-containing protein [Gemmatimonadota bacterium]
MAVRRLKPGWYVLGSIALVLAVWFGAPAAGRRMSFFRVRRIEFSGLQYGAPGDMLARLRIPERLSVFDDFDPVARRAAGLPGVRKASVSRRFPATLRIEISEAEPVAVTPRGDGLRLMDEQGRVLPFDPSRSAPDLPVAAAPDSAVGKLLGRVQDFDPTLFAQVSTAWREQDDIVLEVGGRRLMFRPDATAEEMRAVTAVSEDLARRGRSYRELDGRFAGQVIVRGGA